MHKVQNALQKADVASKIVNAGNELGRGNTDVFRIYLDQQDVEKAINILSKFTDIHPFTGKSPTWPTDYKGDNPPLYIHNNVCEVHPEWTLPCPDCYRY